MGHNATLRVIPMCSNISTFKCTETAWWKETSTNQIPRANQSRSQLNFINTENSLPTQRAYVIRSEKSYSQVYLLWFLFKNSLEKSPTLQLAVSNNWGMDMESLRNLKKNRCFWVWVFIFFFLWYKGKNNLRKTCLAWAHCLHKNKRKIIFLL